MKTKLLLAAALVGAATLSTVSSAQAGVHFGFSFGLPLPPLPVVTVAAPSAPVYISVPVCTAPEVVVAAPACPGPDYVWTPGYWNVYGHSRVWVSGRWNYRPAHVVYGRGYDHSWQP